MGNSVTLSHKHRKMGNIMKFRHLISACVLGTFLFYGCEGENITEVSYVETGDSLAERVGPVSQYGRLLAGKVDGVGHIYGSCEGIVAGKEVQVRGMSMFWSATTQGTTFYNEAGVNSIVQNFKAEVVRLAIATEENWGVPGYVKDPERQRELIKDAVMGAVKNDIYVIIDWHSHTATNQLESASQFFEEMAKEYGNYDNVIFEVFNEPKGQTWEQVREYANKIIAVIRKYSDNLILVGNPNYDQTPSSAIGKEVEDPKNNVAYTLHYYANTHGQSLRSNGSRAMSAGLPLFVSEWGTAKSDGDGTPDLTKNQQWQDWMNENKLSSANWSITSKKEGTAAITPSSKADAFELSESGKLVQSYLKTNPDKYTACKTKK